MSFKLLIESSRDIAELHINFTDGTSVVTSDNSSTVDKPVKEKEQKPRNDDFDFGDYLDNDISQEVVAKPQISERSGDVKVADELQNLDI